MKSKSVFGIMFSLLLISMLTLAFNIQPVKASGTIYIRADGSIDPSTAPIYTADKVTYTFAGDANDSIVVERNNIVVDGAGYTLQGTEVSASKGIHLDGRNNVTIKNMNVKAFYTGINLARSSSCSVSGNNITNNNCGIILTQSSSNSISKNNIKNNENGILLGFSSSNSLKSNSMANNNFNFGVDGIWSSDFVNDVDVSNTVDGKPIYYWVNQQNSAVPLNAGFVALIDCTNITIKGLELKNNHNGILLAGTTNSVISESTVTNNYFGIMLACSSEYNSVSGNNIVNNWNGIILQWSPNNMLRDNNMVNNTYGMGVHGLSLSEFVNDVDTSNTINGKPVYYWINKTDLTVPPNAGYVALVNCTRINVQKLSLSSNAQGVLLAFTTNSTITKNSVTDNRFGVSLYESSNNSIYHNNFINNTHQVYLYRSVNNTWDSGYPSGGNCWSDYTGVDADGDGIGDTPYVIDEDNQDHYPLIHLWSSLPVHNINTGLGYATIQEAINAPETLNGHTIFVEAGTCYENVVVNKAVRLVGEGRDTTIIDGNGVGTVVYITANGVPISNFTIRKSGGYPNSGIKVDANHCTITNNIITNNYEGIWLHDSSYNTVSGNNITANNGDGIWLDSSSNNNISGNSITNNAYEGFKLYVSSNNSISGNSITNNADGIWLYVSSNNNSISENSITNNAHGIVLDISNNNSISENDVTANNGKGIWLQSSSNNSISGNTVITNNDEGIYLYSSSNNSISGNNITNNSLGIWLYSSSNDNSIYENNITNNAYGIKLDFSSNDNSIYENNITNNGYGIRPYFSSNNLIYHNNFIDNAEQVYSISSVNVWDDGYPSGGNYWSDYTGVDVKSGPDQDLPGNDGIGDTAYIIDAENVDYYPLMNPWGAGTPVASFTWTPSIPKIGESIIFDASASTPNGGTILKYEWNFGDGETATGKTVTHTYTNSGTYTVTLNVTDSEGLWDIEQKQIQVVLPHGPEAEFTWTPLTPRTGETIEFDASASQPGWNGTHTMPISEYRWDFGDGNTTTTSTPSIYHTYNTAGNYYVTLTVYAPGATPETDTITHKVTAVSIPVGGYAVLIQVHTKTEPIIPYITLITMLTAIFIKVKRKTKRKR